MEVNAPGIGSAVGARDAAASPSKIFWGKIDQTWANLARFG